ncbi:lanthionine synthetase C family protein [Velocimicrobium porci]|uniref:Lanthionine synthetase C family protein n=1 Tax=Velocimicrobium porci TaxID=2606634 RepID=A0A6L5XV83_9FIRM|nr:lanthionine synthetase C family protein [Velocimicrobium porci]MSS62725.1 lanthionine synthetase C family protein [Velocimicrobium porci]
MNSNRDNQGQLDITNIVKQIGLELVDYERILSILGKEKNIRVLNGIQYKPWEEMTLSHGIPGLCMLYAELNERFPKENWNEIGHQYLEKVALNLSETGIQSISMFSGVAGIGLAAVSLSEKFQNYKKFLFNINHFLLERFFYYIENITFNHGAFISFYDAIEGITGILNYLLIYKKQDEYYKGIEKGISALLELSRTIVVQGENVPGWYVPSKYQFSEIESEIYPNGNFNTSLSHGIAGPMTVLSKMILEGIEIEGQKEAIKRMADFLLEFKSFDKNRVFWKGQISFEEYKEHVVSEKNVIRRDAWCYGTPGICYALVCAGKALQDKQLIESSLKILKDSIGDIRGIFSPTFCHGYAGVYQILLSLEELIGKEYFIGEKIQLKKKIYEFYKKDYIYGFYNVEIDDKNGKLKDYDSIGFLDGCIGTCLALLDGEGKNRNGYWKYAFQLQ